MHTFTHNDMSSILNLQGVIIYKVKEYDLEFAIKIGQPRRPGKCKFCNHKKPNKHGKGLIVLCNLRHVDLDESIELLENSEQTETTINETNILKDLKKLNKLHNGVIPNTSDTYELNCDAVMRYAGGHRKREDRVREKKKRRLAFLLKWREIYGL